MAKRASHEEIERVLKDMREAIQAEKFVFVKRRKNIDRTGIEKNQTIFGFSKRKLVGKLYT